MIDSKINPSAAKNAVRKTAKTTMEATFHFIRWIFLILVIYISVTTVYGYFVSGEQFLQTIITLSVGGFWGFFFGYFGWRLAQSLEQYFSLKKLREK